MTDCDNLYYEVMSFGLKNVGVTYQQLMDQIFKGMLDRNIEVYIDNIVIKSDLCEQHIHNLKNVFTKLRDHGMRLNPDKCGFGVEGEKFIGVMLTHRGIKANQEKCREITEMRNPENTKEIHKLIGWLTTISRFVLKLEEKPKLSSNY